jgi:hypothetical protein
MAYLALQDAWGGVSVTSAWAPEARFLFQELFFRRLRKLDTYVDKMILDTKVKG